MSLRAYANPLYHTLEKLLKEEISIEKARENLEHNLEELEKQYQCIIGRPAQKGEQPNPMAVAMFGFQ